MCHSIKGKYGTYKVYFGAKMFPKWASTQQKLQFWLVQPAKT